MLNIDYSLTGAVASIEAARMQPTKGGTVAYAMRAPLLPPAAPQATEGISYRILVFKHDGRPLVGLGATKNYCSFYFMRSPQVVQRRHAAELKDYDFSGATIRFPADKPLPAALVRKFVVARLKETEAGQKK